ncbi:putative tyrosine-protein kinase Wsck [Orchesella cincta]|uniref:Putative tyrosine-protein kinase Wsck n=1 Tax=Orchesella cincta TaxID=48709 RepID=A0A1D2ND23_ORCCI|nr:putative tyrosine-protein kinase Wsck [Orchesella cincta]
MVAGVTVDQLGCFQKVPQQPTSSQEFQPAYTNQDSLPSFLQNGNSSNASNNSSTNATATTRRSILSFLSSTTTSSSSAPVFPNHHGGNSEEKEDESTVATARDDLLDLWYSPSSPDRHSTDGPKDCIATCFLDSFRFAGVSSTLEGLDCLCGSSYGRYGMGRCLNCTKEPALGCGSLTAFSVYDTGFKVPSSPQQIILLQRTENALRISWRKPLATNGPLSGYKITATPLFSYSHDRVLPQSWEVSDSSKQTYLVGLTASTQYNVTVAAVNEAGTGKLVSAVMWSRIGIPDRPPAPKVIWHNKRQMRVTMERAHNSKGPISAYRLVVIDEHQTPFFNKDRLFTWNESMTVGYPYYIVAEFPPEDFPTDFVIGNGGYNGGFYNGPLPEGHWHPALGVVSSMDGFTELTYSITSHSQHADAFMRNDDHHSHSGSGGGSHERIEVIGEDSPAVVMFLWISIGVSSGVLFLCVALYVMLKIQRRPKRRRTARPLQQYTSPSETSNQLTTSTDLTFSTSFFQGLADAAIIANAHQTGAYTHAGFVHDEDVKTKCLNRLKPVQYIPRTSLDLPGAEVEEGSVLKMVSKGAFGPVYVSQMKNTQTPVTLISIVSDGVNSTESLEEMEQLCKWLDELVKMDKHENVVRLEGFTDTGGEIFLAIEGAINQVPLKHMLLQARSNSGTNLHFTSYQLLLCAMNIAEGMFHLHSYKIMHGQLAAINVLINGDITVPKIMGFGLLKSTPLDGDKDYTRWKAVEQFQNRCTLQCDVWAFGVTCWEIATLGGTPYHEVKTEDLTRHIVRGGRPIQIEMMGDVLYQILCHCWQLNRDERPDFSHLSCSIHELLPQSEGNLFVSQSFNYPPYVHQYEYVPS